MNNEGFTAMTRSKLCEDELIWRTITLFNGEADDIFNITHVSWLTLLRLVSGACIWFSCSLFRVSRANASQALYLMGFIKKDNIIVGRAIDWTFVSNILKMYWGNNPWEADVYIKPRYQLLLCMLYDQESFRHWSVPHHHFDNLSQGQHALQCLFWGMAVTEAFAENNVPTGSYAYARALGDMDSDDTNDV